VIDRLPVGPKHPLFPLFAIIAFGGLLFGPARAADDVPESETHPWFPDHFWPYPVMAVAIVAILGALAWFGPLQSGPAADPRAIFIPRPDWYFLFLFQLLKLGPALVTSILIPLGAVGGLLVWPLLDARFGPALARRLGWRTWPAPGRNVITGTLWLVGLSILAGLTLWALLAPEA
jgi:quinol-cytochrome oxidoreductase complex cytochrome b subunit